MLFLLLQLRVRFLGLGLYTNSAKNDRLDSRQWATPNLSIARQLALIQPSHAACQDSDRTASTFNFDSRRSTRLSLTLIIAIIVVNNEYGVQSRLESQRQPASRQQAHEEKQGKQCPRQHGLFHG